MAATVGLPAVLSAGRPSMRASSNSNSCRSDAGIRPHYELHPELRRSTYNMPPDPPKFAYSEWILGEGPRDFRQSMGRTTSVRERTALTQLRGSAPGGFHLLGERGALSLRAMLLRGALFAGFNLDGSLEAVLRFLQKYASVPMSLADACLVRMAETIADPVILTTDIDFRIYRRHSRQMVPCITPR